MKSLVWLRPTNYMRSCGSEYYASAACSALRSFGLPSSVLGLYDGCWTGVTRPHTNKMLERVTDVLRFFFRLRAIKTPRDRYICKWMSEKLEAFIEAAEVEGIGFLFPFPGVMETLKFLDCPKIVWSLDDPLIFGPDWFDAARECDHIFTISRGSVKQYHDEGIDWVTWLPPGAATETFRPMDGDVRYPIVFIGSNLQDRLSGFRRILKPLIKEFGRDVHLFGSGWRPNGASIHEPVSWNEIPKVLSQSLVAVNLYRERARTCDLSPNLRLFETLASETFLLSDDLHGLDDFFQSGDHLVVGDGENVVDTVKEALTNSEWRMSVAKGGRREILDRHTLEHRMPVLLKTIERL